MRLRPGLVLAFMLTLLPALVHAQASAEWDQHVRYDMDVTLLADRHQMRGTQQLVYTNNSPDTLQQVFYHLYFNAFQPNSMMAERNRQLPDPDGRVVPRIFELDESEIGYHVVQALTQDGAPVDFDLTDTVLRVDLAAPILPGETTVFEMRFRSQVPLQTRRSGRDNREGIDYSMTQWYPKMAMYDETGWHADPYIGREFYAPFGTFDVRITLPSDYVIGSTGVLQNAQEVGHGYGGTGSGPATDADSLTWHFRADQIHDFAWSADPDYIHEEWRGPTGVTYHLLYQPGVAERWQYMTDWLPGIIQFFSQQYGMYPYPQMTVAQGGDGGMEYPMITLITGRRSPGSLFGVTAHETAHMWFYGVLGSNEADYAWMDEGFTSYATTEARRLVTDVENPSHQGSYLSVLRLHDLGLYEPMNTPSDWFTTNTAYGTAAYSAGAMLVNMMGYVIGEEQRQAWLREYFERFKFRHPNPHDVEKVAEDVSGLRLDWYFQQLGYTTHELDYAIEDLDSAPSRDGYRTTVVLEREDEIVMPVDVRLTLADGSEQWINVPLGIMQGHKPVPEDWIVTEPWQWTFPRYTLEVHTDQPVTAAEIDPKGLTPDRNRLNNTASLPLEARFLQPARQDWFHYSLGWRPLLQYAHDFGFGGGLRAEGTYLFGDHQVEAMLKLWPQVIASDGEEPEEGLRGGADGSWFDGVDFEASYETDLTTLGPSSRIGVSTRKHLGIMESRTSVTHPLSSPLADADQSLTLSIIHQNAPWDRRFEIDDFNWFLDENMLSARFAYRVASGRDEVEAGFEVGSSFTDQFDCRGVQNEPVPCVGEFRQRATHLFLNARKSATLGPIRGNAAMKFGLGVETLAFHKRFRLGAPSFEDAWRSNAYRTAAAVSEHEVEDYHFVATQEAGPVAYLLATARPMRSGESRAIGGTPMGTSMLAGTLSLDMGLPVGMPWLQPLRFELFSGAGTTWGYSTQYEGADLQAIPFKFDRVVADAGFGISYDVAGLRPLRRWTAQSDVLSGLHLVAKFPVWASDPELIDRDEDALAFRWLLGIQVDR